VAAAAALIVLRRRTVLAQRTRSALVNSERIPAGEAVPVAIADEFLFTQPADEQATDIFSPATPQNPTIPIAPGSPSSQATSFNLPSYDEGTGGVPAQPAATMRFDLPPAPTTNFDLPAPTTNFDLPAPATNFDLPAPATSFDLPSSFDDAPMPAYAPPTTTPLVPTELPPRASAAPDGAISPDALSEFERLVASFEKDKK
jgi:hypothetical protein